jgi:glutamate racemase
LKAIQLGGFLIYKMINKPIGVFDSGYGGLTILKELVNNLPHYDYIYLGDNARAPYGARSFEVVYQYTLQCVKWLFNQGCPLVIVACNTASAKALRNIQQKDLSKIDPEKRVLGVIRPTAEVMGSFTKTGTIGILGTSGTIQSESYLIEINNFSPNVKVFQQACPLWAPLVENNEFNTQGADYFIKKNIHELLAQSNNIDTILLACTHYPLLISKIKRFIPEEIKLISQGEIIAKSLQVYLKKHDDIEEKCSKNGEILFYTTDSEEDFDKHSGIFYGKDVQSTHIKLS